MRRLVFVLAIVATALAACGSPAPSADGILQIVTGSFPVQYAVERVVGEHVALTDLTRAGVEPHDLELTSKDIDRIDGAELIFYIGAGFQPAVEAAAKRHGGRAVDLGAGLIARQNDPHFWLDPTLMARAVDKIERAVAKADPKHASAFRSDADLYKSELAQLDDVFRTTLARCERREFVVSHDAFGYLAARYGLTQLAITGVSPESEPGPRRIADLASTIQRDGLTTVFYEPLAPRGAANTLAREAGVKTAVLDPVEALSTKQYDAGDTYFTVMRRNLAALKSALGCS